MVVVVVSRRHSREVVREGMERGWNCGVSGRGGNVGVWVGIFVVVVGNEGEDM